MLSEVPAALDAQFRCAERQAPMYVGQLVEPAQLLADAEGVSQVRVLALDGDSVVMRQDHRPGRLNLLIVGGEVVRAAFF